MAIVTAIRTQRHGSKSRQIYLDGEPWRCTSSAVVARRELAVGDSVDPAQLDLELSELEPALARERALLLLSYRDRSLSGLVARLSEDGYTDEVAQSVVSDLHRVGFVDDERYAAALARSLTHVKGMGRSRALREMTHAGIEPEVASAAVDDVLDPDTERDTARRLAEAAAARTGATVDKIASRLVRRGYAPRTAFAAAREAVEALALVRDESAPPDSEDISD